MTAPPLPPSFEPAHLAHVRRNVKTLQQRGAPPDVIAEYLQDEGISARELYSARATEAIKRHRATPSRTARYGPANAAYQGLTLGMGDEIVGTLAGAMSPTLTMQEGRDAMREAQARYREQSPIPNLTLEVAGGLPLAALGGASAIQRGAGIVRNAARLAAGGAAAGGAYGFGEGTGDVVDRVDDAARGAAIGAAGSLGLGAAGGTLGAFGRAVGGPTVASRIGATVLPDALGGRAATRAAEQGTDDAAAAVIARHLARDKQSAGQLAARAARESTDRGTIVADLGGENVRHLAQTIQALPGEGKDALVRAVSGPRLQQRTQRLADDVTRATGVPAQQIDDLAAELIATRSREAKPLYQAAHFADDGTERVTASTVAREALAEVPEFQKAYARGARLLWNEERTTLPAIADVLSGKAPLTVRAVDYLKRGLDVVIESGMRKGNIAKQEARALRQNLDAVLADVDAEVPEFAAARQFFKGEKDLERAMEVGKKVLAMRPEAIAKRVGAGATEGEREVFRKAALDAIRSRVLSVKDRNDAIRTLFGSEQDRARLRALLPTKEAFSQFRVDLLKEARNRRTEQALTTGSRTAPLAASMADVTGGAVADAALSASALGPKGAALAAARRWFQRRKEGTFGPVAQRAGQFLALSPRDPRFRDLVRMLEVLEQSRGIAPATTGAKVRATTRTAAIGIPSGRAGGGSE